MSNLEPPSKTQKHLANLGHRAESSLAAMREPRGAGDLQESDLDHCRHRGCTPSQTPIKPTCYTPHPTTYTLHPTPSTITSISWSGERQAHGAFQERGLLIRHVKHPAAPLCPPPPPFFFLRFRGLGIWCLVSGFWLLVSVSGFGCLVSGFWFRVSGFGFRQVSGFVSLVSGFGFGIRGLGFRFWGLRNW